MGQKDRRNPTFSQHRHKGWLKICRIHRRKLSEFGNTLLKLTDIDLTGRYTSRIDLGLLGPSQKCIFGFSGFLLATISDSRSKSVFIQQRKSNNLKEFSKLDHFNSHRARRLDPSQFGHLCIRKLPGYLLILFDRIFVLDLQQLLTITRLKIHPKCRGNAQHHLEPMCGIWSKFNLSIYKLTYELLRVIHAPSKLALAHTAILKLLLYSGPRWCCDISLAPCHAFSPLKHSPVYKSHASGSQRFLEFPLSESHPL